MKKWFVNFIVLLTLSSVSQAKVSKTFAYNKEDVWRAVLISLSKYPLKVNDYEIGEIVTTRIQEGEYWMPMHRDTSTRNSYQMIFQVFSQSENQTTVSIDKTLKREGNFLDKEKELKTQNIEEEVLFYRIKRELTIDDYVKKVFDN